MFNIEEIIIFSDLLSKFLHIKQKTLFSVELGFSIYQGVNKGLDLWAKWEGNRCKNLQKKAQQDSTFSACSMLMGISHKKEEKYFQIKILKSFEVPLKVFLYFFPEYIQGEKGTKKKKER